MSDAATVRREPPVPPPDRLVVALPSPAGDVVAATSALRALRAALPSARIAWSGRPAALELLGGLTGRDAVLPIEGSLAVGLGSPRRIGARWRAEGADAVLLLTNSWRAAAAARLSGASTRVGCVLRPRSTLARAVLPLSRERWLTHAWTPAREGGEVRPMAMRTWYLELASRLGATDDGRPAALAVTPDGDALAGERLAESDVHAGWFAVSPGAAFGPSKVYPIERVAAVVRRVREASGHVPLVLGGPGEEAMVAELVASVGEPCISTAERPARWSETKALLAQASLLLTTDAGPRHVAAALGTPVVVWMGPTDPRWSAGDEATTTIVRREGLDCLGCHLKTCPIGHPCMNELDPARVVEAALARIRALPPARPPAPPEPRDASPSPTAS